MAIPSSIHLSEEQIADLKAQFYFFDKNDDGKISKKEFAKAFEVLGMEEITEDVIDEVIREADTDGDGKIGYKEFVQYMSTD